MIDVIFKSIVCLLIVDTICNFFINNRNYDKKFWCQNQVILDKKKLDSLFANQTIFIPVEKIKSSDLLKMAYAALYDIT
jgi:hypothetical protein